MVTVDGVPLDEASGVTDENLRGTPVSVVRNVRVSAPWVSPGRRRASRVRVSWDLAILRERAARLAGEGE